MPDTPISTQLPVADSLPADSILNDSIGSGVVPPSIIIQNPARLHDTAPHVSPATANSWILLILFALFAAVCFKFRNNTKYFTNLLRDLTDVRERGNAFDDTVRETSFVTLLNVVCAASVAVLLFITISPASPHHPFNYLQPLACFAAAAIYSICMPPIYWCVGNIFTDHTHAKMWTNGFVTSQAVLGVALFPLSLFTIFYPEARHLLIPVAITLLVIAKLLFISKGFRIFFTKYSSWVTFLYYLCSLEIVPLILTYALAEYLCSKAL